MEPFRRNDVKGCRHVVKRIYSSVIQSTSKYSQVHRPLEVLIFLLSGQLDANFNVKIGVFHQMGDLGINNILYKTIKRLIFREFMKSSFTCAHAEVDFTLSWKR